PVLPNVLRHAGEDMDESPLRGRHAGPPNLRAQAPGRCAGAKSRYVPILWRDQFRAKYGLVRPSPITEFEDLAWAHALHQPEQIPEKDSCVRGRMGPPRVGPQF